VYVVQLKITELNERNSKQQKDYLFACQSARREWLVFPDSLKKATEMDACASLRKQ
jgi:hypothetical protein